MRLAWLTSLLVASSLLTLHESALAAPGPTTPKATSTKTCPAPTSLQGQVTLDPACRYDETIELAHSQTTLDCRGAVIAPTNNNGIVVTGDVTDVRIQDCWLEGASLRVVPPKRKPDETDDALRARSPRNVVLSHVSVKSAQSSGIFVGPVVENVTVESSVVDDSTSVGIYLEYGTRHLTMRGNLLRKNGISGKGGVTRTEWTRREGIAVDASAENVIEDNRFEDNGFGGVFLYKNCWEHHSTASNSLPRTQHARGNVIRRNTFVGMPFGVWIASRQARDLGAWDCGDPTTYPNPITLTDAFPASYPKFRSTIPARYDYSDEYIIAQLDGRPCLGGCLPARTAIYIWPDFAEDNVVEENVFERISMAGVRVEDDRATIRKNTFVGDFDYVYVGTPFRARYLGKPVADTVVSDNGFLPVVGASRSFADHIALVPNEHTGTTVANNAVVCPLPWGGYLRNTESVVAYEHERDATCRSETRTCRDGALDGSFAAQACAAATSSTSEETVTPDPPASASPAAATVPTGQDQRSGCSIASPPQLVSGPSLLIACVGAMRARRRRPLSKSGSSTNARD